MNTNWAKILLFSLLGFALGFLVCRTCCGGHRGCGSERACHDGGASCEHGHGSKGSRCKGGDEHHEIRGGHGVYSIVSGLEKVGFQGDTTVVIDGGTVNVKRTGDDVEVRVEMNHVKGEKEVVIEEKTSTH